MVPMSKPVGEKLPYWAPLWDVSSHEGGPHFVTVSGIFIKAENFLSSS